MRSNSVSRPLTSRLRFPDVKISEAPVLCVVPLCVTALGCVALFFFADELRSWLLPIAEVGGGSSE